VNKDGVGDLVHQSYTFSYIKLHLPGYRPGQNNVEITLKDMVIFISFNCSI